MSNNGSLPSWIAGFMKDGRFIIYGLLLVLGTVFLPHGLVSPALFDRGKWFRRQRAKGSEQ
jgi:branched-chain amino acid transport system permease protein